MQCGGLWAYICPGAPQGLLTDLEAARKAAEGGAERVRIAGEWEGRRAGGRVDWDAECEGRMDGRSA